MLKFAHDISCSFDIFAQQKVAVYAKGIEEPVLKRFYNANFMLCYCFKHSDWLKNFVVNHNA